MSGSLNKVNLIGNLGRNPEIRYASTGAKIVNLSLATSERWKDRVTGEMKEKTEWHRIVVFNDHIANLCENYLQKGAKIYIEGSLQTRKWTDQEGVEKYTTEIILQRFRGSIIILDNKNSSSVNSEIRDVDNSKNLNQSSDSGINEKLLSDPIDNNFKKKSSNFDDEIPF